MREGGGREAKEKRLSHSRPEHDSVENPVYILQRKTQKMKVNGNIYYILAVRVTQRGVLFLFLLFSNSSAAKLQCRFGTVRASVLPPSV